MFGLNLYGGLQAAAFSDVGLAWSDIFSAGSAIDGYGVGLRVLFPFVDVIRMDLALGEPGRRSCLARHQAEGGQAARSCAVTSAADSPS